MKPDGSSLRYLYTTVGPVAWSPDGFSVVTVEEGGRYFDPYPRPLVVIDPETAEPRKISPAEVEDREPQWSPQEDVLVFQSSPPVRTGPCTACPPEVPGQGIWVMRPDGSERRQLTSALDWLDSRPAWSEDGEWIVFLRQGPAYVSNEGFAKTQLWLMRPDGSQLHLLADITAETSSTGPVRLVDAPATIAPFPPISRLAPYPFP